MSEITALELPGRTSELEHQSAVLLNNLPEEILWHILRFLDVEPPSHHAAGQVPDLVSLRSGAVPLKNLSRVSRRWRRLVIPFLFKHVKLDLVDLLAHAAELPHDTPPPSRTPDKSLDISEFATAYDLQEITGTLTICAAEDTLLISASRFSPTVIAMWSDLLPLFNPDRLTIVAPPPILATLIGCYVSMKDEWAFQIKYQRLDFENNVTLSRNVGSDDSLSLTRRNRTESMLGILWPFKFGTWSGFNYHGGSCLNAFGTYHYFDKRAPCILVDNPSFVHDLSSSLSTLCYTAVFPHYVHFSKVVSRISKLSSLRSLSVQLAPSTDSTVLDNLELIGKGNLNLRDCWAEVERSYMRLIEVILVNGHPQQPLLATFSSRDCRIPALQADIQVMLDIRGWTQDGNETWISDMGMARLNAKNGFTKGMLPFL